MRSEKFDSIIGFVLDHEGRVLENVKDDPGGMTKFGISKKSYPNLDIENLTEEQAKDIYFKDYWKPEWELLDTKTALSLFDSAVNCGSGTVAGWVFTGNNTYERILFKRLRRYADICQKNRKLEKFLLGWLIRVLHIWERY